MSDQTETVEAPEHSRGGDFDGWDESVMQRLTEPLQTRTEEIIEEREERKQDTTKKGRKSKTAKLADVEEKLQQHAHMFLEKFNQFCENRDAPEFTFSDEEQEQVAILGGRILNRHLEITSLKYGDEIMLGIVLAGWAENSYGAYAKRCREEGREPWPKNIDTSSFDLFNSDEDTDETNDSAASSDATGTGAEQQPDEGVSPHAERGA